jgi:ketopantoate reductase
VNVLIIGPGVIGTVYGTQLGAAGHAISVVEHGNRTDVIAARGLHARDVSSGVETHAPVRVVSSAGAPDLDVVRWPYDAPISRARSGPRTPRA